MKQGEIEMTVYKLGDHSPQLPEKGEYWVAPSAQVMGQVRLGSNASIWFNAVLRGDNALIDIGEGSNIQDNSTLHVDPGFALSVGKGCTIGHNVILHGCTIGDGSLVGMGSTILNGAKIGKNCIVGANALVTEGKEYPDGSLIVGSPATAVKELGDAQKGMLKMAAEIYAKKWREFNEGLSVIEGA